jgi:hypothetical protein
MNARILLLILSSFLLTQLASAQTRKIGHRSHSGAPATFAMLMDEDHLGARMPIVEYEVEPMIGRIKKHYEYLAKHGPSTKAEKPKSPDLPDPVQTADTAKGNLLSPTPSIDEPKSPEHPKVKKNRKEPQPTATAVPSPDFLVQARPKSSPVAPSNGPSSSNLWMLLGLLAFPIAPGVFFASAVMGRKRNAEA